ncbi:MAG: hypothetical protein JST32_21430, partial [Bacteroidetes bacterium]|nr:hypothetical protein [Bacteroidota bacterium]
MFARIDMSKIDKIRQDFIDGQTDSKKLAKELGVCTSTVNKYRKEFREIQRRFPGKLKKYGFRLPFKWAGHPPDPRQKELYAVLPMLVDNMTTSYVKVGQLWNDYRSLYPDGFSLSAFQRSFYSWKKNTGMCDFTNRRVKEISPEDRVILNNWYHSNRKDRWEMALVLLGSYEKRNLKEMARQVEHHWTTI